MILMPLYGDQYTNAMAAQARGAALLLEYEHLNERTLRHALNELFNNTRYFLSPFVGHRILYFVSGNRGNRGNLIRPPHTSMG